MRPAFFVITAILAIAFALGIDLPAMAGNVPVIKLKQTSPNLGNVVVYVSASGCRVERGPMVTVCRAPHWMLYSFNPTKKLYVAKTYEGAIKLAHTAESSSIALMDEGSPWHKGGAAIVAGFPALKYSNPGGPRSQALKVRNLRYWKYDGKDVPAKASEYVNAVFGTPPLGGLPLRFIYNGTLSATLPLGARQMVEGDIVKDQTWLETREASHTVCDERLFDMPPGYKLINNITQLYLNGGGLTKDNFIMKDLMKDPSALFQSQ